VTYDMFANEMYFVRADPKFEGEPEDVAQARKIFARRMPEIKNYALLRVWKTDSPEWIQSNYDAVLKLKQGGRASFWIWLDIWRVPVGELVEAVRLGREIRYNQKYW
jgi:hypothetical protein